MSRRELAFKGAVLVGARVDGAQFVQKTVAVAAGQSTGTVAVVAGSVVIGCVPAGNQDQFVDNVAISGTTLTVTLAANATGINTFKVTVLEP